MRTIIKILLFPITLILTFVVALLRVLCTLSNMVLSMLAFVVLVIGIGVFVLMQSPSDAYPIFSLALLISPFGIPLIATFLTELLGIFNETLKEI